jgi:hypothetical protein
MHNFYNEKEWISKLYDQHPWFILQHKKELFVIRREERAYIYLTMRPCFCADARKRRCRFLKIRRSSPGACFRWKSGALGAFQVEHKFGHQYPRNHLAPLFLCVRRRSLEHCWQLLPNKKTLCIRPQSTQPPIIF